MKRPLVRSRSDRALGGVSAVQKILHIVIIDLEVVREVQDVVEGFIHVKDDSVFSGVEADAAFEDGVDVVIADGFVGNVMLKGAEGLAHATVFWLKQMLTKNALRYVGAFLAQKAFVELKAQGWNPLKKA